MERMETDGSTDVTSREKAMLEEMSNLRRRMSELDPQSKQEARQAARRRVHSGDNFKIFADNVNRLVEYNRDHKFGLGGGERQRPNDL